MSPIVLLLIPVGLFCCLLSVVALLVLAPAFLGMSTAGTSANGLGNARGKGGKQKANPQGGAAAATPPVPCDKIERPGWEYTRRVKSGAKWQCPSGFVDNGCTWADGGRLGELQCKRKVGGGEWGSENYGGSGGKTPFDDRCVAGHYISGITLFHGERDTNAIYAQCYDPTGVVQPYDLFKSAGSGIRGKYDTPPGVGSTFLSVLSGSSGGRKSHPSTSVTDSIQGFYKWDVKTMKPNGKGVRNEVQGLKVYSKDGRETLMAGGSAKFDASLDLKTGQCPPGKVLTGIAGRHGDRLDSVKFMCDAPVT